MSKAAAKLTIEDAGREVARVYLEDRIYDVLVNREDPAKTGEVLRGVGIEEVTLRTIRYILSTRPRFELIDRKWTVAARIQDKQRPFERVVESALKGYGRPMPLSALTLDMSAIYGRPVSFYEETLPRTLSAAGKFFAVDEESFGIWGWMVVPVDTGDPSDVLFENYMDEKNVAPYKKTLGKAEWDVNDFAATVEKLIEDAGHPIPMKVLAYYAWESLKKQYKPIEFYSAIALSDKLEILSNQQVISSQLKQNIMKSVVDLVAEIEEMPMDVEEEVEAGPVTVTESDKDEIVALVLKKGGMVSAEEILDSVIEITPEEKGYAEALESLNDVLKDEDRIISVGPNRWRPAGTLPEDIFDVPEVLLIPEHTPYETPEGDIYDQELEDDGLEPEVRQEILNPLVQDIGDEDPEVTAYQPLDTYQRCVLKYHHKETGTLPLIQFHPDFFGRDPEVIQVTLVDEGIRRDAWINNKTRLMYGLKDWLTPEMPISGACFEIYKTDKPGEYRFVYDNRTDAMVFVPTSRLLELLALKDEAETNEMPLFDIITRILEHYRKGIGFVPLFTEVNLVKRVSRRLVASILSSYHCFHTRGKTGEWQYDIKKRSQGFNKAKRKYIKK